MKDVEARQFCTRLDSFKAVEPKPSRTSYVSVLWARLERGTIEGYI